MKKLFAVLFILSFIFLIQDCKKSNGSGNNNNNNNKPQPTAVGTPTGVKTSKLIPASGGSITSDDGKIELSFPNGALSSDDTISIQPITNNCPGGTGSAYRLEPEGLKFSQPVTIKFHYDDSTLQSTLSQFMLIAFQDSSGLWRVLDNGNNDTVQHVISGNITHFSDWTQVEEVAITPENATLKVGNDITLSIINTNVADLGLDPEGKKGYALLKGNGATWAVNGVTNGNDQYGTITVNPEVSPLYDFVKYTAPKAAPPKDKNPVLVSAEFNQKFLFYENGTIGGVANKAILYAHILIIDGGYTVQLSFQADDLEMGSDFLIKDQGSFDVVLAGSTGYVKNINNSDANITLVTDNGSTCVTTVASPGQAPIHIVDSSFVSLNPVTNQINIIFNSLDQKNWVRGVLYDYSCPNNDNGQIGGALGPPFPALLAFDAVDSVQHIDLTSQYKMVVTPIK